jgi:hypothetical protein
MKMSPFNIKVQEAMAPGVITEQGFLGTDKRNYPEIIQDDELKFQTMRIDWDTVAIKLEYLLNEGLKGLGEFRTVDNKWLCRVAETRGKLPSPFKDGLFFKRSVHIKNISNNEELFFSDLSLHMLKAHHFLQGKGSAFRMEPEKLKKVLDI